MKTWLRKAVFAAAVIAALAVSLPSAVQAQANDNDGCKLSTLKGDYALRISGQIFNSIGAVVTQLDGIVMQHYDGAGNITQEGVVFANGVVVPGPTDSTTGFHIIETGIYTVNPDCTGTVTVTVPSPGLGLSGAVIQVMFVLSNHGRTIHQIVSSLTPPGPAEKQVAVPANIHADGEKLGVVGKDRDEKQFGSKTRSTRRGADPQ
jgi:hypothetical protein